MTSVAALVELWTASRRAITAVEKQLDAALQQQVGIPFTTYAVLCTIAEFSDRQLSQQHIADELGIDKSSVSRQLDAAVRSGLVTSTPSAESRRSRSVALTEEGRDALRKAEAVVAEIATELQLDGIDQATRFLSGLAE
jgi:DNA-binding MarR family transcriptional regulator